MLHYGKIGFAESVLRKRLDSWEREPSDLSTSMTKSRNSKKWMLSDVKRMIVSVLTPRWPIVALERVPEKSTAENLLLDVRMKMHVEGPKHFADFSVLASYDSLKDVFYDGSAVFELCLPESAEGLWELWIGRISWRNWVGQSVEHLLLLSINLVLHVV